MPKPLLIELTERRWQCECCGGQSTTTVTLSSPDGRRVYGELKRDSHFGEGDELRDSMAVLSKALGFLGYAVARKDDLVAVSKDGDDLLLMEVDAAWLEDTDEVRFLGDFAPAREDPYNVDLLDLVLASLGHRSTVRRRDSRCEEVEESVREPRRRP